MTKTKKTTATDKKTRAKWNSTTDAELCHLLVKEKRCGNSSDGGFKATVYNAIAMKMTAAGHVFDGDQIRSRYQRLKGDFKIVRTLRQLSGFGWDDDKKLVTAEDIVWDAYIEKNAKAASFRDVPFPLFDVLAELVEGTMAMGEFAISSITFDEKDEGDRGELVTEDESFVDKDTDAGDLSGGNRSMDADENQVPVSKRSSAPPDDTRLPKRNRPSHVSALTAVAEKIDTFISILTDGPQASVAASAGPGSLSTPARKDAAFRRVREKEGLSPHSLARARKVFRGSGERADEYLSFTDDEAEARAYWLQDELEKAAMAT